jgi:hypothetical protein
MKKTLYRLDKDGNMLFIEIMVMQSDYSTEGVIKKQWGRVNGKHQTDYRYVKKGKNLGKSNSTTPYQQAIAEAESMVRVKENSGYIQVFVPNSISIKEIQNDQELYNKILDRLPKTKQDASGRTKPMLVKHLRLSTYEKGSNEHKKSSAPKYPGVVQPKMDGVCCKASKEHKLVTRGGKNSLVANGTDWVLLCPQIYQDVVSLDSIYEVHGEVYAHGYTLEQIKEACVKQTDLSSKLRLYIFDVVAPDLKMEERMKVLQNLQDSIDQKGLEHICTFIEKTYTVEDEEDLLMYENQFLEEGYEGLIFRGFGKGTEYKIGGRSTKVLKLVRFDSQELEIVDVIPMDNDPELGMFVVAWEGGTFNVTPGAGFSRKDRINLLSNKLKYIGQMLTIEHRGYTNLGTPRIATGKSVRPANDL